MGIPTKTAQSIRLFGGNLAITYNEAVNHVEVDYGASFTFNNGSSTVGYLSGDGTTTIDWETTHANPVNASSDTLAVAVGIVQSVSTTQNSASSAASAISISGIVSATLDLSQPHPLATIVYSEACYPVDNYGNVVFSTAAGVGYICDGAVTGANTTTHTVEVHVQGPGTPSTAYFGNNQIARTSDDTSNVPVIVPLTVIAAPASSSAGRVSTATKIAIGMI